MRSPADDHDRERIVTLAVDDGRGFERWLAYRVASALAERRLARDLLPRVAAAGSAPAALIGHAGRILATAMPPA